MHVQPQLQRKAGPDTPAADRKAHLVPPSPSAAASLWPLRALLTVSMPGDPDEVEADRIAEQVTRSPAGPVGADGPAASAAPVARVHRKCAHCEEEERLQRKCAHCEEEEEKLRRKEAPGGSAAPGAAVGVREVVGSPGHPLDPATRAFFEMRMGRELGHVRVHADARAAASAESVSARAYTLGRDVVFGAGEYAPGTGEGRRLLAHELVHVVQQGDGGEPRIARVPTRRGAQDGRYSFSTNCGWIDWSHAVPAIANTLIARVRAASDALRTAAPGAPATTGDVTSPTMTSTAPGGIVLSSATVSVRLVRALSADEVLQVALGIYKQLSLTFETQQEWTDLIGESSFAQEDLPSNLISFYMAARGYTRDDVNRFCGTQDAAASVAEYDRNHSFTRNRTFAPIGATGPWPPEFSTIDDSAASGLFEIRSISATQGSESYRFCPMYRIVGTIGETDLFILSYGGARFTAADDVRVVPTFRFRAGTHGAYGHTTFVEVRPARASDEATFRTRGLSSPIEVPERVLVCLTSHGNAP